MPELLPSKKICSQPNPGQAGCFVHALVNEDGTFKVFGTPSGYGPAEFRAAYGLSGTAANPTTIALVEAYDNPTAEHDLKVYTQQFKLPACTTANGCFKKVNQSGKQGNYPLPPTKRSDFGWLVESALDVEIAHAICQNCNILLVEAKSSSFSDLLAADDTAHQLGATVISNSWGASEFNGQTDSDTHFNYKGVVFTFSSGDSGFGVSYPAASPYVTAVGGTTLMLNSDKTRQSETAWSGSGAGCSAYEPKPMWQTDTRCTQRTVADVSADADPNTGAAVYTSFGPLFQVLSGGIPTIPVGWLQIGGTSLSSPLIAGVYALAGNSSSIEYGSYPYSHPDSLFDVTAGSDTTSCSSYLCEAGPGYDGPTGLGTPIGTGSF